MRNKPFLTSLSLLALAGSLNSTGVLAQDEAIMEEVITTGTRIAGRTATESMAPVDVVSGDDFVNQGDTDLSNLLRNIVPSYNVNTQPLSDAATIVRPANLRGLAPDHTLVLVNGKRRHRAAVIYWLGNGVADGAQGPDISVIPAIALQQVEVLRDGASAQYGSDAIAGVMNFKLKEDSEGGALEVRYGEFFEGDGDQVTVAGNVGLPFTSNGFANLSFEIGSTDPTDRSIQRNDAAALIAGGNTAVGNPAQVWGQPQIDDDVKLFANIGLELDANKEFYAFGNYAEKEVEGGFFFRNPDTRGGVFGRGLNNVDGANETILDARGNPVPLHIDASGAVIPVADMLDGNGVLLGQLPGTRRFDRLVADLTGDNSGGCMQTGPDNSGGLDIRDAAGLADTIADPNCFVFNELFPGGFTPRFGGQVNDIAATVGVRGETDAGLRWDVSGSLGRNEVDFFIRNTVNASLGPQTPTKFDPGVYSQLEKNFNIDLSYPLAVDFLASDLNIAGGFEYREEQFEITVGDQASFEIGPLADQGFSAASNGFPGFSPLAAGEWDRANFAAYVDVETDITDIWVFGAAFRWEDFEDFGTTTNGKVSSNVRITDNFSLRGTYSTGFRAPTPGQSNAFNVSTEFDAETGDLVNNGTIPSINPVAVLRGGQPLDAEESTNFTLGAVLDFEDVTITIDYFNIELEDRITVSQNFSLTEAEVDDLVASGVTSAANLQNFRFFTNDFDTTTEGFDIVATWGVEWANSSTDFNLAYNQTETEIDSFTPGLLDDVRIRELQEGLPETRWNISANHLMGNWRFLGRVSFYDEFYDSEDDKSYGSEVLVDAEVAYTFNEKYTVTFGAQNLLDEFPDENPDGADQAGRRYSQFSPSGFNGGFYYLRLRYDL
ncbi:TonB-dependent receptor [Exilibacterium tricleocarpae]|uniref:TonB-dependent receptor n=1 Tax=Exilibacterium tricleocarpae TaxID=2591008 RepID=A0A545TFN6_9GAMM|nr:TonB-dependent receptor [Exilibacterium tricleocarpae]TQV76039.1 TonB-dependent receptor [Exilibacterium tricleocarpae]